MKSRAVIIVLNQPQFWNKKKNNVNDMDNSRASTCSYREFHWLISNFHESRMTIICGKFEYWEGLILVYLRFEFPRHVIPTTSFRVNPKYVIEFEKRIR